MDLNAKVENISPEQLDILLGEASPSGTPSADDLIVGKVNESTNINDNIPTLDLDNLEGTQIKKEEQPPASTEKVDATPKPEEVDAPQLTDEELIQRKSVLKNTVDFLIEKGYWKDFEDRDKLDIDDETYAQLAAQQEEAKVSELFEELVDSTGLYGKAIISHIKNGGNPDEIIDIFKEQKVIENIDVKDERGQLALIEKYYSEVVGWNKAKIDKHVAMWKGEEDGLANEAKEVQDKFDTLYSEQIKEIEEREDKNRLEREKVQDEYKKTLVSAIDTSEVYTDKEKRMIKDSVLKFNKKLPNGNPINDFYIKFYQIQNDPTQYADLVYWVMDRAGYDNKLKTKQETKIVEKTWNFIKGNAAVTKQGGTIPQRETSKETKFSFSGLK